MSWFNFHVTDTKDVVRELKRLNDLLELTIRLQFDYHVTPPTPLTPDAEPDTVTYSSDEDLAKRELLDEVKRYEAVADELEHEQETDK